MPRQPMPLPDALWAQVARGADDACWLWTGRPPPGGFKMMFHGRQELVNRLVWLFAGNTLQPNMHIGTTCENRLCLNPAHLCEGRGSEGLAGTYRRFMQRVDQTSGHGPWGNCWLWRGQVQGAKYGRFIYKKKRILAHRFSWLFHTGADAGTLFVCHTCDVHTCVNPAHLFLGTQRDNMRDMAAKGRDGAHTHPESTERGETRYCAQLTEDAVRALRRRYIAGERVTALAREYGVNPGTVSNVVHFKRWQHVLS